MASADHFEQELLRQMGRAGPSRSKAYRDQFRRVAALGDFPRPAQQSPSCCDVMEHEMKSGDVLLVERSSKAGLTIRSRLPR